VNVRNGKNSRNKDKAKTATVYYCAGHPAPTEADSEVLFLTEPAGDLTEGQAELKRKFAKMGDQWLSRTELEQMLYANGDASETENAKTAKEIVDWAHGVDVWQHRPIYIEKNRMSPNYRKVCYAGWIDKELWSNFPPVEPRSSEYFRKVRKYGPYNLAAKSEQYNPMNGCNPLWQEETALETGVCVIDERGLFIGSKFFAAERAKVHKANRAWELQEVAKWTEEKRKRAKGTKAQGGRRAQTARREAQRGTRDQEDYRKARAIRRATP
jgi:hypothetical protein